PYTTLFRSEMKPGRLRMLVAGMNQRLATLVQDAEVPDQRLQSGAKARRRDHGVDLNAGAIGEHRGLILEPLERSDDADPTAAHRLDEPDVEDRDHPAAHEVRVRPCRRGQPVRYEIADRDAAKR